MATVTSKWLSCVCGASRQLWFPTSPFLTFDIISNISDIFSDISDIISDISDIPKKDFRNLWHFRHPPKGLPTFPTSSRHAAYCRSRTKFRTSSDILNNKILYILATITTAWREWIAISSLFNNTHVKNARMNRIIFLNWYCTMYFLCLRKVRDIEFKHRKLRECVARWFRWYKVGNWGRTPVCRLLRIIMYLSLRVPPWELNLF